MRKGECINGTMCVGCFFVKKDKVVCNVLCVGLVLLFGFVAMVGFGLFASASIPFQDSPMAPASAIARNDAEMTIGIYLCLLGVVQLITTIIWRISVAVEYGGC